MPRRPEIGNIQLYPNRPLKKSDKNGFVLKFYCPIQQKRIRKNCGTRDRREARKILRECRERLLNGEYTTSGGAITENHATQSPTPHVSVGDHGDGKSWQECFEKYRKHHKKRVRPSTHTDAVYGLGIAERIFENYRREIGLPEGFAVTDVMTLEMLDYLQDQLLEGAECRYEQRSPHTVNSMMAVVMAFVRFCHDRDWIEKVPRVQKLETDEVMKGRPVTTEEFERMLEAVPSVVGESSAESWQFALKILWESGFRIGDLMDFHWDNQNRIHPWEPVSEFKRWSDATIDIGLCVSYSETFCYVATDCMGLGIPVVGSRCVPTIKESLTVDPDDLNGIATKVIGLIEQYENRSQEAIQHYAKIKAANDRELKEISREIINA